MWHTFTVLSLFSFLTPEVLSQINGRALKQTAFVKNKAYPQHYNSPILYLNAQLLSRPITFKESYATLFERTLSNVVSSLQFYSGSVLSCIRACMLGCGGLVWQLVITLSELSDSLCWQFVPVWCGMCVCV